MELQPLEAAQKALDFAKKARRTMCDEFQVNRVADIAIMAKLGQITPSGRCRNGLAYRIHGRGFHAYSANNAGLLVDASRLWPKDSRAGSDDGIFDQIESCMIQIFLESWISTRYSLAAIDAACQECCVRGILRRVGPGLFELLPETGLGAG